MSANIPRKRRVHKMVDTKVGGLTGLKNFANNCYLNAVVQSLRVIPAIRDFFLDDCNFASYSQSQVTLAFSKLLRLMWRTEEQVISCLDLKKVIGSIKPNYNGNSQEDCLEVLCHFLSWFHDDLRKSSIENIEVIGELSSKETVWEYLRQLENSVVREQFHTLEMSSIVCQRCGNVSSSFQEPTCTISLDIPTDVSGCSLNDCLQLYLKSTLINDYDCMRCKRAVTIKKMVSFARLAPVLVLHIKRFNNFSIGSSEKDQTFVKYPHLLRLNECDKEKEFELYSVICHIGNMYSGHYFCFSKIDGSWYKFNDSIINPASLTDVVHKDAVILFYIEKNVAEKDFFQTSSKCNVIPNVPKSKVLKKKLSSTFSSSSDLFDSPVKKKFRKDIEVNGTVARHYARHEDVAHDHAYLVQPEDNHVLVPKEIIKNETFLNARNQSIPEEVTQVDKIEKNVAEKNLLQILSKCNVIPNVPESKVLKTKLSSTFSSSSDLFDSPVKEKFCKDIEVKAIVTRHYARHEDVAHDHAYFVQPEDNHGLVLREFINNETFLNARNLTSPGHLTQEDNELLKTNCSLNNETLFQDVQKRDLGLVDRRFEKYGGNVEETSGKRCAALNCKKTSVSLFRFPKCTGSETEDGIRCLIWLQRCGNTFLLKTQPEKLHKYFLCNNHFTNDQFCNDQKRRLQQDAIPTIFDGLPIEQVLMLKYVPNFSLKNLGEVPADSCSVSIKSKSDVENSNEVVLNNSPILNVESSIVRRQEIEVFNNLSTVNHHIVENTAVFGNESNSTHSTRNSQLVTSTTRNEIIESVTGNLNAHSFQKHLQHNNAKQQKTECRKCAAINCPNTGSISFFSFPKLDVSNHDSVKRCLIWIQMSGNPLFLQEDLQNIHKHYYLCGKHFKAEQFTTGKRNRLKKGTIPSIFNCLPIDNLVMLKHFRKFYEVDHVEQGDDKSNQLNYYPYIIQFEEKMKTLHFQYCDNCKEKRLTFNSSKCSSKCSHFSAKNNMDPGEVPNQLKDLSFVEEQLIARNHPCISVFKLKGLQYGYSGNVITFPQDITEFSKILPHRVEDLPSILTLKYKNYAEPEENSKYFQVRSRKVYEALVWLKSNNKYYSDIEISKQNLNLLPDDGSVYSQLESFCLENGLDKEDETEIMQNDLFQGDGENGTAAEENDNVMFSGLPKKFLPKCDDQVTATIYEWPTISQNPINEFNTPGYIACAFPTLFPTGEADLRDGRSKSISASDYFKHLLNYYDGRFAKHITFRFFALNSYMRWNALTNGSLFVRKNAEFSNLTVLELKNMLQENPTIVKKIFYQGNNLRGTRSFWSVRYGELTDMIKQIGLPTIYFTLSSADLHWPDLFRLLCDDKDPANLSEKERRELLQANPYIVDCFFSHRIEAFIEKVLSPVFEVTDYWYRFEWQNRGSKHFHGVAWLNGAPDVRCLKQASQDELRRVIEYFDKLVSAVNPIVNCEIFDTHPCRKLFQDNDNINKDLSELLVKVQRHTRCSSAYCVRTNKKTGKKECRFKFPMNVIESSTIGESENGELEFLPARNDPLLNKYNACVLQSWRANIDIAPVISERALILYLSKYITKHEANSTSLLEVLNVIMEELQESDHVRSALRKLYINMVSERDYSAQEVCSILSGTKLYSAGKRNFVVINFSRWNEWVQVVNTEGTYIQSGKSSIEKYQTRPEVFESFSLYDTCLKFDMNTWVTKRKCNIVRIFPRVSLGNGVDTDDQYYRQKVLLHVPWRTEGDFALDQYSWKEIYESKGLLLHETHNTDFNDLQNKELEEYESEEEAEHDPLDESMILSRIGPKNQISPIELGLRAVDLEYNWNESSSAYEQYGSLDELRCIIQTQKNCCQDDAALFPEIDDLNISYSIEQLQIINFMKEQIKTLTISSETRLGAPKRVIVQGKAGTGKSCVIKYLTKSLTEQFGGHSYLLLAPTGVAALNIDGQTIHSGLRIPIAHGDLKELKSESAKNFCDQMANVKFLIIDEYSMIGCSLLDKIDQRCRQGKGSDEIFGGLNVYLVGDESQLPPVCDVALYSPKQHSACAKRGKALIMSFELVFYLSECFRQKDSEFQKILDRLSAGESDETDYNSLSKRFVCNVKDSSSFDSTIRLYATRQQVNSYNIDKLANAKDEKTGQFIPIARICARHNTKLASKIENDNAGGLEQVIYLSKGCKVMLRSNLWTKKGLVNGSIGEVVDILYKADEQPPHGFPSVILCTFKCYTGPGIGPNKDLVPIPAMLATCMSNTEENLTRTQFPLVLCYACSIHKSQGLTLEKAVIDIGPREFSLGLTYVALSRVKSIQEKPADPNEKVEEN